MLRNKLALLALMISALGACGGRSGLRVGVDGGSGIDGGGTGTQLDGKVDTRPSDASSLPDGRRIDTDAIGDTTDPRGNGDGRVGDGGGLVTDARPDIPLTGNPDGNRPDLVLNPDALRDTGTDGPGGTTNPEVAATLSSVEISPSSPITVNVGTPVTITITAIYSDNTTKDVSGSATVTSANTSVLTVAGTTLTGLGTSVATTTITATYQGKNATATVTVNGTNPLLSISISGAPTASLAVGGTATLVATGVFTDGTKQDVTATA